MVFQGRMELKGKLIDYKNIFIQEYWADPVWSKVISAIIIGIGTGLFVIIKSLYERISIKSAAEPIIKYFSSETELNNMLLWIGLFIICWALIVFVKTLIGKFKKVSSTEYYINDNGKGREKGKTKKRTSIATSKNKGKATA